MSRRLGDAGLASISSSKLDQRWVNGGEWRRHEADDTLRWATRPTGAPRVPKCSCAALGMALPLAPGRPTDGGPAKRAVVSSRKLHAVYAGTLSCVFA